MAPLELIDLDALLKGYSAVLKATPSNGVVSVDGTSVILSGTSRNLNVFSLDSDQSISGVLKFDVPSESTVLANVAGRLTEWEAVGFELPGGGCRGGSGDFCTHILYNFGDAEVLTFTGISVQGTILAPYAGFGGFGGNVDGQVFVGTLKGSIEYHPYLFSGCLRQ